jgi:GNAT superfamily N-acetyltransferase
MAFDFEMAERITDTIRLRSGAVLSLRFAGPGDAGPLQDYFRGLPMVSRYNRLMTATKELPDNLLARFIRPGTDDAYSIVATVAGDRGEVVVAEARYAYHADETAVEFGLSVDDHWQGHGLGRALLVNLQCRTAAFGADQLYGDTLRTNVAMLALARKSGFALVTSPYDWKQVRLAKPVTYAPQEIPCANWRLAKAAADGAHRMFN